MPCIVSAGCESLQATVPDSVVRLFLGVDVIQSPFMTLLLEKLPEFLGDDDFIFHNGQKIYIPRLLLSQFRFLDRIVDGKELTKKLLEILSSTSVDVQIEIMACIPDIVEDSEHGEVARKLREELMGNKDLTCPVIDALTYLNISSDLVTEIRTSVLDMLKTFSINDLPIVINFLLESVTAQEALEVRCDMCYNINQLSTDVIDNRIKTSIKLTIDALKSRMQFKRAVAEAWLKALDAAKDFKPIDIFVLLILHWLNNKKAVESLMRNKIRNGLITEANLHSTITSYTSIIREYFPSLMSLARGLLHSPEPSICSIACSIYKMTFTAFDSYCKQEIVESLITHTGSGVIGEIEASLDTFADLVKDQLQAMSRYAAHVKIVLDCLDHNNLTVTQIKKVYLLLAKLAFHSSQEVSYLQDDLHIIICKQLTSGNPKYKRMGVVGALSIVHALAASNGTSTDLPSDQYKQVVKLLELIQNNCKRDPEISALFLDSLAEMIGTEKLYGNVETWVADNMTQVFEENYVADVEEDADLIKNSLLPIDVLYSLNNVTESTIVINLIPLVEKLMDKTPRQPMDSATSPLCLAPLFHLVAVCEMRKSDGDLENIDALLGCPVLMVKPEIYEQMKSLPTKKKDIVCAGLFLCINWFREVANGFAAMSNAEMKAKVMMRLTQITELNHILQKCLALHPDFQPPTAIFDVDCQPVTTPLPGPSTSGGDKKVKKAPKKKKGKKSIDPIDDVDIDDTILTRQSTTSQVASQTDHQKTVDLSNFRQYFRELDFKVFNILNAGIITRAALDSEMHTRATEELQIGLAELHFLLEDLALKLKHSLIASASKRRTFFKVRTSKNVGYSMLDHFSPSHIATEASKLLPCLCDHLERACNFFQTLISDNDGMVDGPNRGTEEATKMASCYNVLLQCVLSLFSWNGFNSEENKDLLKEMLMVMGKRMSGSSDLSSFVSLQDSLIMAFKYFGNLVETSPDTETAATLIKLLMVLADRCQSDDLNAKLASHAKSFLGRDWRKPDGERMKGAKHNEDLQVMIKAYLEYDPEPLQALEDVTNGLAELVNLDKNGCSEDFVSLNRQTFTIFYKVLLTELISNIKRIPAGKKNDPENVREDRLMMWTLTVKVLQVATSLTKVFNARGNLGAALKYGRQFLEIFLRQAMPLLDVTFRRHHTDVEKLLRSLQQSTRMLQHLCGHSKINKDIALTNQVPMLRKALEGLVFRVKAMLTLNNCQDAFWVGNLKNRNLRGEVILSQASMSNTTSNSEDEGEDNENQTAAAVDEEDDNDDDEEDDADDESE
ncbi:unnamed protein product, partial [Lymnaea stagnalis]